MSQFRTLSDIYKLRSEKFAKALIDVLFDMDYETLMTTTRLSDKRCREILQARNDAMTALEIEENDK